MKQQVKRGLKAMLRATLISKLVGLRGTLVMARETLAAIRRTPAPWDEAAVQLDELRSEARRFGYPQYLYGLLCAARTTRAVGALEFTAIEFGVAGGNGLVAMEQYAAIVERRWGVSIQVVGFDSSVGLPQPTDPRDCPFAFRGGEFAMDEAKLRSRLGRAELRLGDVAETVRAFAKEGAAPVGFVANDLDLYTSTRASFALFDLEPHRLLPRVALYFDDLLGYPYTTVNGEWAAIEEFNTTHTNRRVGRIHGLGHCLGRAYRFAGWSEMMFVLHLFDHPDYNSKEKMALPDLKLRRTA